MVKKKLITIFNILFIITLILMNKSILSNPKNDQWQDTNKSYKENIVNHYDLSLSCKPYKHWMIKEIYEQEYTILRAINNGGRIKNKYEVKLGGLDNMKDILKKIKIKLIFDCGWGYRGGLIGENFSAWAKRARYLEPRGFELDEIHFAIGKFS